MRRLRPALAALVLGTLAVGAGFDWPGKVEVVGRGLTAIEAARRREAVETLAGMDPGRTRAPLLRALADPERDVRLMAGQLLGKHGAAEAVAPVSAWLASTDPVERLAAVQILGAIAHRSAIPPLTRALADAEASYRREVIRALEAIGGPEVVVPIIGRLDDEAAPVRRAAAEALREIGDARAVVPLLGRIGDASREVRVAAIQALGRRGDVKSGRALLRLLDDPLPEVRVAAIEALGLLGTEDALPILLGMLSRDDEGKAAAIALARLGGPRAAEAIVASLERPATRAAAHEALLILGPQAIPALLDVLTGRAVGDPTSTLIALGRLGDRRATGALIDELQRGRVPTARVLDALRLVGDPAALPALLVELRLPDAQHRIRVLDALESIVDARAADTLTELLADRDKEVRERAIVLLGLSGARPAVAALVGALGDREPRVRLAAAVALGRTRDRRATGPLLERLTERDAALARRAADALAEIGDPAAMGALLGRIGGGGKEAPTGPWGVERLEALRALVGVVRGRELGEARKMLERTALGDAPSAAAHAIDALGAARDPHATEVLVRIARGAGPRRLDAVRALATATHAGARETLAAALGDPDAEVRAAAAWAAALGGDGSALPAGLRAVALGADASAAANATAALARRGQLGRADGLALTRHRSAAVRANAALGLGMVKPGNGGPVPDAARARLIDLLEEDASPLVRQAAARALARAGGEAKRLRAALEREMEPKVREALAMGLPGAGPGPAPVRQTAAQSWKGITWLETDGSALRRPAGFQLVDGAGFVLIGVVPAHAETMIEAVPEGPLDFEILDETGEPAPTTIEG